LVSRLQQHIIELRRRRVFRALLAWGIFSFTVLQIVEPIMHALDLRDWTLKLVVALLGIGFPATALLSWAYDLTAKGIIRTPALSVMTELGWERAPVDVHLLDAAWKSGAPVLGEGPPAGPALVGSMKEVVDLQPPSESGQASAGLPRSFTRLIGRESELRAIIAALAASPLVTVTGPGGTGKTRVAIAVAESVPRELARRIAFVDVAAIKDPAMVPRIAAAALQLRDLALDGGVTEAIVSALRDESVLVIVDNCEHLVEACANFVASLLAGCKGVHVLATSQLPLGAAGEVVYRLAPLATPPEEPTPSQEALAAWRTRYPALELLVARLSAIDPGFELSAAQAPHAAEICRRLDGLPLALELVAPRSRVLSLSEIAEQLGHRFKLLSRGDRDLPSRQQGLTAVLEWSYGLLSQVEQRALERLSVFAGTFSFQAAAALWRPIDADGAVLVDLLQGLVEKSFVIAQRTGEDDRRFRLLETVRQYAQQRLDTSGDGEDARARLLEWAIALSEGDGRPGRRWHELVGTEYENLRVAFEYAMATPLHGLAGLRLATGLWHFWLFRGYHSGFTALERSLAFAPEAPAALKAEALVAFAILKSFQQDIPGIRAAAEAGLPLALALQDERLVALARLGLSWADLFDGRFESGAALADEATGCARRSGVRWVVALALHGRSASASVRGDAALALQCMREAVSLADEDAPALLRMYLGFNLGLQAYATGQFSEARQTWHEAFADALHFSVRRGVAGCLEGAAFFEADRGAWTRAAHLLGAAGRLREITQAPLFPQWVALHASSEARVRAALGDAFDQERLAGAALPFEEATALGLEVLS
jgi:predicted ATPase